MAGIRLLQARRTAASFGLVQRGTASQFGETKTLQMSLTCALLTVVQGAASVKLGSPPAFAVSETSGWSASVSSRSALRCAGIVPLVIGPSNPLGNMLQLRRRLTFPSHLRFCLLVSQQSVNLLGHFVSSLFQKPDVKMCIALRAVG